MDRKDLIDRLKRAHRPIAPGQEIQVGPFEPGDALGVSLCYYEIYRGHFPIDHVHDPEAVARRNAGEEQYTVVARTPKGEIVGLAGLFRNAPNPLAYEVGQLMVLKPYRKGDLSSRITAYILGELPNSLGIPVIFGEAVCNHTVSQRLAQEFGHRATGLALECMPATAYAGERSGARNISLLLTFDVRKDTPHTVYLPSDHGPFITELYGRLGLDRRVGEPGGEGGPDGITAHTEFLLPEAGFARITVQRAGRDFPQIVDNAGAVGTGVVQIYMNLGDKAAPWAVEQLQKNGYFFGGLLPLWSGTDAAIMQKLSRPPAWEEVRLHHPEARALAAYIRQCHDRTASYQGPASRP